MTYPPSHSPYPTPGAYAPAVPSYASWIQRVGAYLVDALCVLPFSLLAAVLGQDTDLATGLVTYNAMFYVFTLIGVVVFGYNRWFQAGKTGQSWGRKALGLKLVGTGTGQPIGAGKAFLRDLAHVIDGIICYIGYLFPLWDAKRQTLADKIVNTVVTR
ncbi:RDD family protein [Actinoplanes sp. NPDC023936]|uniref:RDD family protein n=1 Tax=Actinoplanes sp. NPDC023936 TaxID=3154910 RepID=UPI0033DEC90D